MGSFGLGGLAGLANLDPVAMKRQQALAALQPPIQPDRPDQSLMAAMPPQNVTGRQPLGQYLSQTPQAFQPGPVPGPTVQPRVEMELPEPQMGTSKALALSGVQGLGQTGQMQALTPEQQRVYGRGRLQAGFEDMAQAGPPKASGGFVSRLKNAGIGLLLGGLPGAAAGAINPQIINNIRHRIGLGQAAQDADQEMAGQVHQQRGMQDYGQQTGQVYGTAQPTLQAREFEQRQEGLNQQREATQDYRSERLRQHDEEIKRQNTALREATAKNHVALSAKRKQPVDPSVVKGTSSEAFAGKVPPDDPAEIDRVIRTYAQFGVPVPKELAQGPYSGLAGKAAPKHDPNAITPAQRLAEQREQRMEQKQHSDEEKAAGKEYESAVKAAKESDIKLRQAQAALKQTTMKLKAQKIDPETDEYVQALKEEVSQHEANSRSAWGEVGGHVDRLESDYGWKASRQNPQYPSAQRPTGQRQSAPSGGGGKRAVGTVSQKDVEDFATENKLTPAQARAAFEKEGYQVK